MKLTPDIKYSFLIEEDIMSELNFNLIIKEDDFKKTGNKIVIEKTKKQKLKNDSSTRLF